jgi:tagaturonate reductase
MMLQLSKHTLPNSATGVSIPGNECFQLPERVLQFGTGVLLRGLPDYFIDKANKLGVFNGRIVVVKSTDHGGDAKLFQQQDMLYTQCERGFSKGIEIDEVTVNASWSRLLSARLHWDAVVACAANPDIEIVISNTTEAGLQLSAEDAWGQYPPVSFPGKLLALLYHRYQVFNGDRAKGWVILPTELVTNNGDVLKSLVISLAMRFALPAPFLQWIEQATYFCNTLVDRIVPGRMPASEHAQMEQRLGYVDPLMIMSETYRLWAIETMDEEVRQRLSFAAADEAVIITPDIRKYVELKLRLLNGTHSFCCAIAYMLGFDNVKQAMANDEFSGFLQALMCEEIIPCLIDNEIAHSEAQQFADDVLDRFRNPFLDHKWLSIALEYTGKMKMRNVPLLQRYYQRIGKMPERMTFGFAAYLLFMRCQQNEAGQFEGSINGQVYRVQDSLAGILSEAWKKANPDEVLNSVFSNETLWGTNLDELPGFRSQVQNCMESIEGAGMAVAFSNRVACRSLQG